MKKLVLESAQRLRGILRRRGGDSGSDIEAMVYPIAYAFAKISWETPIARDSPR